MDRKQSSFQPLAFTLTVLAALVRLVPHPPNFAPIGSVALFGGARLRGWQAYLVPVLAMMVTDPIRSYMEGYGYPAYSAGTAVIYGSFLISVFLGRLFLRKSTNPVRIGTVALAGSVQFFLITNLMSWWGMYTHSVAGLLECYTAALPFFARTVAADLFYSGVLFGAYALLSRRLEAGHDAAAAHS
ncbi:MAG TPA: DUF6580 family putative transport protein [Bryobacteraceae bacterium]|jgi:hypothetical protein